jgi:two-component system sensor histidine kinase YesM
MEAIQIAEINRILQEVRYQGVEQDDQALTHIGLKNIAERIRIQYGDLYYIKIYANQPSGIP